MTNRLNILLLSRYFPPEIGTAANLFFELGRALVKSGHTVTAVTSFPWYNLQKIPHKYTGKFYIKENMEGVEVFRLAIPLFGPKKMKLAAGHLTAPLTALLGGLLVEKPDIIFGYSPPLFMGLAGSILARIKATPFVLGVQDVHPQCYIDQGVLKNKFLISLLEKFEKHCYQRSSLITVHSASNVKHIVNVKGAPPNKVKVLPNWIDTNELIPLLRENDFSRKHNLNGRFVVGYAGTFGMSQGLVNVIEAASLIKDRSEIKFFIVGDGLEKEKMVAKTRNLGLKNIKFLAMQPKSVYPYVLASSDLQLVTLNSRVKTPVVPSKILSIMAAGRPLLASMPLDGDAPKLIEKADCGICIEPGNPQALAEKILYLHDNREMCERFERNGRKYVVENLSLTKAINDIEDIFNEALQGDSQGNGVA